jgi:hypothetical protein
VRRLALAALLAAPAPAGALDWVPIAGVQALGGVHGFDGARTTLSGNADAVLAGAIALGPDWSLLPSLRSTYEGTRRAVDILGTGTLSQERMSHRAGARFVRSFKDSPWRLKPGASYKLTLLKETRDERWGRGLFDERLWTLGLEAELLLREPSSLRASLDWFEASHPNYSTLESQAQFQFAGRALARELVGDRALDRRGLRAAVTADLAATERVRVETAASTVWSLYPRQRVVNDAGLFDDENRTDFLSSLSAAARMPHEWNADLRALASLELAARFQRSSQNGYDASRGRFLSRFYDWRELSLTPGARLLIGPARKPVIVDASLGWRRRDYPNRPPQNGQGVYQGGSLSTTEWTFTGSVTYPIARRFSLVALVERASASSNQRFEQYYRYAYETTNLLAGVRWDW